MIDVIDDYHAWEAYPQYRWVFNKLELSLRLGYHAGPAGIPVKHTGWYIVRPIYNPYGMGIGAHKKWLDADWYDDMSNHKQLLITESHVINNVYPFKSEALNARLK